MLRSIQITMAESFGVSDRGGSTMRPAPSATSSRTTCCRCWAISRWGPPTGEDHRRRTRSEGCAAEGRRSTKAGRRCPRQYKGYKQVPVVWLQVPRLRPSSPLSFISIAALGWRSHLHSRRQSHASHVHGSDCGVQASAARNLP